jgi:hypothetical protein
MLMIYSIQLTQYLDTFFFKLPLIFCLPYIPIGVYLNFYIQKYNNT